MMDGDSGITILIAEDNEDSRLMLRDFLESEGYKVVEAKDGQEAIEMAQLVSPDLILLDLNLPLLDGVAVAIKIRCLAELKEVPIIANSADGLRGIELFNNIKNLGDAYIGYETKPLNLETLSEQINMVLKKRAKAA